jgi:hypothetical protein
MHPKHGWTHVYSPAEEEAHRKMGWVDDVPSPKLAKKVDPVPVVEEKRPVGRPRKVDDDRP